MSMWLNLAKVPPSLLDEIRTRPELLDALFFEADTPPPAGFDPQSDVFGCDYRTLNAVAEGMAAQEEPGADWREKYVFLSRALGEDERDQLEGYEFTYGPAFTLTAADVVTVHQGLSEEGWSFDDLEDELLDLTSAPAEDEIEAIDSDDDDDDDDAEPDYDDFDELLPFFAAAAREGKAIVGGIG